MASFFKVPVYYTVCEQILVKADSAEQALEFVQLEQDKIPTNCKYAEYVGDSYEVAESVEAVSSLSEEEVQKQLSTKKGPGYFDVPFLVSRGDVVL